MDRIYQTDDSELALTLAALGVKHPRDNDGLETPCRNQYDAVILRRYGYGGKDIPIEKASIDAHAKGLPGAVVYLFVDSPDLQAIVKAWNARKERFAESEYSTLDDIDIRAAAEVACNLAMAREHFMDLWSKVPPMFRVDGKSKTTSEGIRTETTGSFRAMTCGASKATRAHLKL